jgi:hypothetical protein
LAAERWNYRFAIDHELCGRAKSRGRQHTTVEFVSNGHRHIFEAYFIAIAHDVIPAAANSTR